MSLMERTRRGAAAVSPRANGKDHASPPHSLEAEQAVLGALLLDSTCWTNVVGKVRPEDFYRADHRIIFAAIAALAGAGNACDLVTVGEQLTRAGQLEDAGGLAYLGTLARDTPGTANVRSYADIVHERAELRRLQLLADEVARAVADGATTQQIREALGDTLAALAPPDPRPPLFNAVSSPIGLQTFTEAQLPPEFIVDNFWPRDVGARVGAGGAAKSTLALWEAIHVVMGWKLYGHDVLRPGKVLIVSGEDTLQRIRFRVRMLCEQMRDLTEAAKEHIARSILVEDLAGKGVRLVAVDHDGNLVQTAAVDALIDAYAGAGLSLIHVDPLVYFGPGERFVNDAEAAMAQVGLRIVSGLDAAQLYTHHTGKANAREARTDQYASRGGSALPDGMRYVQVLTRVDKPDETTPGEFAGEDFAHGRVLSLHVPKITDAAPIAGPVWIRRTGWRFEHIVPRPDGRQDAQRERIRKLYAFVKVQSAAGIKHSCRSLEDAASDIGLGRNEVRGTLHAALELRHLIEQPLPPEEQRARRKSYIAAGLTP